MDEKVLRKFKTNNITTMENIFHNCSKLMSITATKKEESVSKNASDSSDVIWIIKQEII